MAGDRKRILIFLFALSAALVAGIAQLAFGKLVEISMKSAGWEENFLAWWIPFLISVIVLFALFWIAAEKAGRIIGARVTYAVDPPPAKWLITGYSTLTGENPVARIEADLETMIAGGKRSMFSLNKQDFETAWRELVAGRQDPLPEKPPFWSWQQSVRAAACHGASLERILVLDRDLPDPKVSGPQHSGTFEEFRVWLHDALKEACPNLKLDEIRIITMRDGATPFAVADHRGGRPRDYEDFEYVDTGLRRGLDMLFGKAPPDERVCIDVTPGQKVFSIVAGAITFNEKCRFSYVAGDGRVNFYDAKLDFDSSGADLF